MKKQHLRHGLIAAALVITFSTAVGVAATGASNHGQARGRLPVATGDLGEIVVTGQRPRITAVSDERADPRLLEIVVTASPLPRSAADADLAAVLVRTSERAGAATALC
jgi:hypothetical protein